MQLTPLKLPLSTLLGATETELVILSNLSDAELETLGRFLLTVRIRLFVEEDDNWNYEEELDYWLSQALAGEKNLIHSFKLTAKDYIEWRHISLKNPSKQNSEAEMIARLYPIYFEDGVYTP